MASKVTGRSAPCWLGPLSSSTPAPGKRVTSVKVDVSRHCTPLCVGRPAHAAPAAGSGKKPTPVSHGSPLPCPHQPAGPAWTWADGQECTREPALRPGAGRGRVGGEGNSAQELEKTSRHQACVFMLLSSASDFPFYYTYFPFILLCSLCCSDYGIKLNGQLNNIFCITWNKSN